MKKTIIILFVVVLIVCVVISVPVGLTFAASQSNTNIPLFSDLVEKIETTAVSDKDYAKMVSNEIVKELDKLKTVPQDVESITTNIPSQMFKYTFKVQASGKDIPAMSYSGSGAVDTSNNKVAFDLNTKNENDKKFNSDFRIIGDKDAPIIFFRSSELSKALPMEDIDNKWIEADIKKLMKDFNIDPKSASTSNTKKNSEEIENIKKFFQSETLQDNFKRLPDEIINNVRTNCFEEYLDKDAYIALTKELDSDSLDNESIKNISDNFKYVRFTMCVGRMDKLPYKVKAEFSFAYTKNSAASAIPTLESLVMELNFADYNKPVTIETPEADMDIKELMSAYFMMQYSL